ARLIARSIFSLGMLAALAFCKTALNLELVAGSAVPFFTANVMSLPIRVNTRAIWPHRLNFLAFLYSKALPIGYLAAIYRSVGMAIHWYILTLQVNRSAKIQNTLLNLQLNIMPI